MTIHLTSKAPDASWPELLDCLRQKAQGEANEAYEGQDNRKAYGWKEVARLLDAAKCVVKKIGN